MSGAPASGSTWWVMKTPCRWRAHPALIRRNFSVVLDRIWPDGRRYTKADIMPDNFTSNGVSQLNLFKASPEPRSLCSAGNRMLFRKAASVPVT